MSEHFDADVAVVGAGPTGLATALGLAASGLEVTLVARAAPHDPRTTALLMEAVTFLERLGAWEAAAAHAAPLRIMRLIDDTGRLPPAPEVDFDACEIGFEAFGYNLANDDLNAALQSALDATGHIGRIDAPAEALEFEEDAVTVLAEDDRRVRARLVVGADGAHSVVREAAGIGVRRWHYEQQALVTTFRHSRPHLNVSTEFHRPAGPFTLVPLPGDRSSLVWVDRPAEIGRAAGLADHLLNETIATRSHRILGDLAVDGPRGVIGLEGLLAHRMIGRRVALVGEAGHRFPPIGAQGLNLGLRDSEALAHILGRAFQYGEDVGGEQVLARYQRARWLDVTTRTGGVDMLNRSLLTGLPPVALGRSLSLAAAKHLGPLRRIMMRAGMGRTPLRVLR